MHAATRHPSVGRRLLGGKPCARQPALLEHLSKGAWAALGSHCEEDLNCLLKTRLREIMEAGKGLVPENYRSAKAGDLKTMDCVEKMGPVARLTEPIGE